MPRQNSRQNRQARRAKALDVAALIEKMKLVVLPTDDLTPYEKNPRINDGAVDAVAASIKKFGFADPIVVRGRNNEIINGHTRWKAAKQLGLARVPCLRGDHLTEAEARAFRIADNKTHELSTWDDGLLRMEIADLPDFDFADFGFSPLDLGGDGDETNSSDEENSTEGYQHVLKFDKTIIPLTDEEHDEFKRRLDAHCDENGVVFGFIRSLLIEDGQ